MEITYVMIYLFCNLFQTYILYYLYKIFFDKAKSSRRLEIISYLLYFVVNSAVYLLFKLPLLNVISSLLGFILLALNYRSSLLRLIFTPILIYIFMASAETLAVSLFLDTEISLSEANLHTVTTIPIASTIIMYIIALFLGKLKNIKQEIKIPVFYWLMLVCIPGTSLFFLVLVVQDNTLPLHKISIFAMLTLFFVFSTFYMFDVVISRLSDKMEKDLLRVENKFYNNHLQQLKSSVNSTQKLQHDLKNHLFTIRTYASNGNYDELLAYLNEINYATEQLPDLILTGNTSIDSILNFKVEEAAQKGITIQTTLQIPKISDLSPLDFVIILGNLLDNSINAVEKLAEEEKKVIVLNMRESKGRLLIHIENPYVGELETKNGKFCSTKRNKEKHGFGLDNVRDTIHKYNGTMEISSLNKLFTINIVLYLPKNL